jgi:hypothetical protein
MWSGQSSGPSVDPGARHSEGDQPLPSAAPNHGSPVTAIYIYIYIQWTDRVPKYMLSLQFAAARIRSLITQHLFAVTAIPVAYVGRIYARYHSSFDRDYHRGSI